MVRKKRAINALIADIKTRSFPVDMIILFGSALNKNFNEYSDLDICIVHKQELKERQLRELELYFKDAVSNEVDIDFVYCSADKLQSGQHVFESIRKEGRVLYEHI